MCSRKKIERRKNKKKKRRSLQKIKINQLSFNPKYTFSNIIKLYVFIYTHFVTQKKKLLNLIIFNLPRNYLKMTDSLTKNIIYCCYFEFGINFLNNL